MFTIPVGLLSLTAPEGTVRFNGLSPQGGSGITEIRLVLGGLFIALGVAPFFLGDAAFMVLGISCLAMAVVRLPDIFIDNQVLKRIGSAWFLKLFSA